MLQRHVDAESLISVAYSHNGEPRRALVLAEVLEGSAPFLNTYSRRGALKVSRGCSVPITREQLIH